MCYKYCTVKGLLKTLFRGEQRNDLCETISCKLLAFSQFSCEKTEQRDILSVPIYTTSCCENKVLTRKCNTISLARASLIQST